MMPKVSTSCWYFSGTRKYEKIRTMTKMLSTLSDSSIT